MNLSTRNSMVSGIARRMPTRKFSRLPGIRAQRVSLMANAAEGASVAPAPGPAITSVATLLTRHILRDGELVLLILKPSRLFIVINSLRFVAVVLIALCAIQIARAPFIHYYVEAAVFAIAGRVTWAVLNWMGRLYVLTDQRIVRLAGVFTIDIFDCPLRRVGCTRLVPTFRERLLRLGSIEIIPSDDTRPCGLWQTIRRPVEINEEIQAALRKAKQGGLGF